MEKKTQKQKLSPQFYLLIQKKKKEQNKVVFLSLAHHNMLH